MKFDIYFIHFYYFYRAQSASRYVLVMRAHVRIPFFISRHLSLVFQLTSCVYFMCTVHQHRIKPHTTIAY